MPVSHRGPAVRPTRYGDQRQTFKKRKSKSPRAKSTIPAFNSEINKRFLTIRNKLKLTQAELANKLSSPGIVITVSTIKAIENYVVAPNIYILRRLKDISGVSYDYLLDGKGRLLLTQ